VLIQTARETEQSGEFWKTQSREVENRLYDSLRQCVPVIDAAITKIIRLTGGYKVVAEKEFAQELLDDFCNNVSVGTSGKSIYSFTDSYFDSLITYGNAVGEYVIDNENYSFLGLYNANFSGIHIEKGREPFSKIFYKKKIDGSKERLRNPERIIFTALAPTNGEIYGRSVLRGLPALSKTLLKIYQCIGQNYERTGNVRYAVLYKPPASGPEKSQTRERVTAIAKEWAEGMRSSRCGEIRDFVCSGDVEIKVIGAENKLMDTNIPVRQLLEQLISKLSIPPFLLGLSWSTTERMSAQQCDILTSELEYYRRLLNPVIIEICDTFLKLSGISTKLSVEWSNINLQDESELALARLNNAKALEIEKKIEKE
jgi:hypothetical protein